MLSRCSSGRPWGAAAASGTRSPGKFLSPDDDRSFGALVKHEFTMLGILFFSDCRSVYTRSQISENDMFIREVGDTDRMREGF